MIGADDGTRQYFEQKSMVYQLLTSEEHVQPKPTNLGSDPW